MHLLLISFKTVTFNPAHLTYAHSKCDELGKYAFELIFIDRTMTWHCDSKETSEKLLLEFNNTVRTTIGIIS